MFDTTPKISNDPKHLDEFDRIFKHGDYADKEGAPQGDICEKECCGKHEDCEEKP
jgi:hypothetical protein